MLLLHSTYLCHSLLVPICGMHFIRVWPQYQCFLNGPNPASFCLFSFFSQCKDKYSTNLTKNGKSINGVLGTRTKDGRMEGFLAFNVKCNLCVFIFMVFSSLPNEVQSFAPYLLKENPALLLGINPRWWLQWTLSQACWLLPNFITMIKC